MADGEQQRGRGPTFLDLVADYQATYGHRPDPDMDWPEFVALIERTGRFPAREMLLQMDAVAGAIGTAFGGGKDGKARAARKRLTDIAYPGTEPDTETKLVMLKENDRGA